MYLLKKVHNSNESYAYIHFFQGADLPIKSQQEIFDFFNKNIGKEFVSIETERKKMAENKCHYYHLFCHNRYFRKNRLVKAANFGLVQMQKWFGIQKNTDIDLYQGSALFSITTQLADYLLQHEEVIKQRFKLSLAADECFIQTMVMASDFKDRLYKDNTGNFSNARLIDRSRPDGKNSPHIWRDEEYEFILSQPEDKCFARKFDENIAPNIITNIEKHYN